MTQSKPKSKAVQKIQTPAEQAFKLLEQCSSEELKALAEEIVQILWERQIVEEGDAHPGPGTPAEEVFARLKERYEKKKGA